MTKQDFLSYLRAGDFRQLFLECFWNNPTTSAPYRIALGDAEMEVREVAQKGLKVYVSRVETLPDSATRRLIDTKLRKLSHDYFVIFVSTAEPFHHLWSIPVKTVDRRQLVTVEYVNDDQAAFLLEKMNALTFSLDENPTVLDVVARVHAAFLVNTTEVTKQFYQCFRREHDRFVAGIENITGKDEREWYASVMLNQLMFCYFIQKKRFLNFDEDYLGNKLRETQAKRGRDRFYESFYRSFLKQLFSDGLDKPVAARSDYFLRKYGRIPYLNGGMFSMHQIEKENKDIDIPDAVFERLFAFFDEWHWHLDSRLTATGRDINPDVLGYIFEQYINDRAQMGAYYTKEDITEYIGRNTIVPWLWRKATGGAKVDFGILTQRGEEALGDLGELGARYLFPAMRKGIDLPLPPEIEKGVAVEPQTTLRARRAEWNRPANESYALPTEIWRETVSRRQRCAEIREKFAKGEIKDIHDFITYNLDIRAFAEDVIRTTDDHLLVLHFYKALREVTVLDPTCGSGAFLFAALNILEPLYEACLDRMEEFHERNQRLFEDELAEIAGKFRSNRQYFIYKNIILRNLYGVDIMHEAVEIARLRLFLKMVAVVDVDPSDDNLGLDPLPDIDFNIRCGNTLVGYAMEKEIEDGLVNGDMFAYAELKGRIDEEMRKTSMAFDFFRREQLNLQGDHQQLVDAKKEINKRLKAIRDLLDSHLYDRHSGKTKEQWLADTQPFHWYTEFYPIMKGRGGFDVIIGNPPYLELRELEKYKLPDTYSTLPCANLYASVMERCDGIVSEKGRLGFIVPVSSVSTDRYATLQDILKQHDHWYSNYDDRPCRLFEQLEHIRLSIHIMAPPSQQRLNFATGYRRWGEGERATLFERVCYVPSRAGQIAGTLPKLTSDIEDSIIEKMNNCRTVASYMTNGSETIYYTRKLGSFVQVLDFVPVIRDSANRLRKPSELKTVSFDSKCDATSTLLGLNSNLFRWFLTVYSDCRNLNKREVESYPIPFGSLSGEKDARKLASRLMKAFQDTSEMRTMGNLTIQCIIPRKNKPIIDEIDELMAKHYGFTEEELDFIINYDIKYRMGDELNS